MNILLNVFVNRISVFLVIIGCLSGCSSYSSSFVCGDARGANCISMDMVDRMISSGEIERFNEANKKCRGRRCKKLEKKEIQALQQVNSMPVHFINRGKK